MVSSRSTHGATHSAESIQLTNLSQAEIQAVDSAESSRVRGGAPAATAEPQRDSPAWAAWSQSLQSILDQPTAALPNRMLFAGLLFCGAVGAWAWLGRVQEISHAAGQLAPQGQVYKVESVIQGEVVRLLIKPGQHVKAGQLIAELDSRLASAEVNRLQQSLGLDQLQKFQAQELLNRTVLEAQSRRAVTLAQTQAQAAALVKAQANAATQAEMLPQAEADLAATAQRLERLKPLLAEGALAQEQVFGIEQSWRERQQALTQKQGELASAQAEAKRFAAELSQQQAEAKRSELETGQRLQQLKLDTTALNAKINETENLLKAAQTQLQASYVYAPVNGTVSMLHVDNVGEVMHTGETIAEIAPDGVPLILSARLPNREAGLVRTGMEVQVKFDAFPYQEYGTVKGKVLSISPDAEQDEQLGAVYRVDISLARSVANRSHQPIQLKAGQTARAEIVVRQRRIIDLLLKPFRALQFNSLDL